MELTSDSVLHPVPLAFVQSHHNTPDPGCRNWFVSLSTEPVTVLTASTQKYYKMKVVFCYHFSTLMLSRLVSTASG